MLTCLALQGPLRLRNGAPLSDRPILTHPMVPPHQQQPDVRQQPFPSQGNARPPFPSQGSAQQPFQNEGSAQHPFARQGSGQQPFPSVQQPFARQGSTQQSYFGEGSTLQAYSREGSMQQPHFSEGSTQQQPLGPPPGLPFGQRQQPSMHSSSASQHGNGSGELPVQYSAPRIVPARQRKKHPGVDHNISLQTAGSNGWAHDLNSFNPDAGTLPLGEGPGTQHAQRAAQRGTRRERRADLQDSNGVVPAQRAQQPNGLSPDHASNRLPAQQGSHVMGFFHRLNISDHIAHPQPSSSSHYGDEYSSSRSADGHTGQSSQHLAGNSSVRLMNRPQLGLSSQPKHRPYEPPKQPPLHDHAASRPPGLGQPRDHMQPPVQSQADGWDVPTSHGYHEQPQSDLYVHDGYHHQSSTWDHDTASSSVHGGDANGSQHAQANNHGGHESLGFGQSQGHRSTSLFGRAPSGHVLMVPRPASFGTQGSFQGAGSHGPREPQIRPPPGLDSGAGEPIHSQNCLCTF